MARKKKKTLGHQTFQPRSKDPRRAAALREEHVRTVYARQGDREFTQITRHPDGSRTVELDEEAAGAIRRQRERFIERFGREPGPDDPIFFDAQADSPQPMEDMDWDLIFEAFEQTGVPIAYAEAWRELGYLVTDMNRHTFSYHEIHAWEDAVERHRAVDE